MFLAIFAGPLLPNTPILPLSTAALAALFTELFTSAAEQLFAEVAGQTVRFS